jgi:NADPH:quinone reductase-like Zn-dependent oxidoreductase
MARIVRIHEYGDASILKIENLDVPPPDADEVQIDVKSIGLNRAEVMFRTHAYLQEAQFPSRLGYEAAGIVKTVGTSVTSFKKGDVVSLIPPTDIARWGTYGELANVPRSQPCQTSAEHLFWRGGSFVDAVCHCLGSPH